MRALTPLSGTLVAASLFALVACGGGGDEDPAAQQASGPGTVSELLPGSALVGTASACFNSALFTTGTTFELDYEVSGGRTGNINTAGSVGARTTFNGHADVVPVQRATVSVYSAPVPIATSETLISYESSDGFDVLRYGNEPPPMISTISVRTIIDPVERDQRFTLAQGGTATYQSTSTSTRTVNSLLPPMSTTTATTTMVTYLGQESVTVPAGTFMACKFQDDVSDGARRTSWVILGKGVVARSVTASPGEPDVTMQLQGSSRLNGVAL